MRDQRNRRFIVYTCSVADGLGFSFELAASKSEACANAVAMGHLLFQNLERATDRVFVRESGTNKMREYVLGRSNTFEEVVLDSAEFRAIG